jgi:hypothetical protein
VLNLDLPAVGSQAAQPVEVLYTDYGTAVVAQRPAPDQISEAPDDLYRTLDD